MTSKEWAVEAFEKCDHAGMICMSCAENTIKAAIEEDRELHPRKAQDVNEQLTREEVHARV